MSTLFTKIAVPVSLLVAGAIVAGGCGGDTKANASTSNGGNDFAAFQECLQDAGIDMPQGGGPGGGGGQPPEGAPAGGPPPGDADGPMGNMSEEQRAAFEKCRDQMPDSGRPQMSDEQQQQMAAQRTKMEACMKQAGVELPTGPGGGGQPPQGSEAGERPQMDAKTQQAMQTCSKQVGGFGEPGGRGPGGAPQGTDPAAST